MTRRPPAAAAATGLLVALTVAAGSLSACATDGAPAADPSVAAGGDGEPGTPGTGPAMTDAAEPGNRVVLSAGEPAARVPALLPAPGTRGPGAAPALRLAVESVDNPSLAPVGIVATLGAPGAESRELGRVYLFPPDRPGTFFIPLGPSEVADLAAATRNGDGTALHLSLDVPDPPPDSLSLAISAALAE